MNYALGIDIGTSGVKIIILNNLREIVKETTKTYPIYQNHLGWSEQNPDDWWFSLKAGLNETLQDIDKSKIKSIGVSGQMHGLVSLDENYEPIIPAILWNDQRSHIETDYLNQLIGKEKLIDLTGNIAFPGFTAPKVLWLQKNKREIFSKIKYICLPKDYINYKLTGTLFTDVSDASGTLYFDVKNRKWSQDMLQILNINESMLPLVYESFEIAGHVSEAAEQETGIPVQIPVIAGAGDNAAGALGVDVVEEGTTMISLGTSGVVFAPQSAFKPDKDARLHTFCHANGKWHVMGVTLSAASCLKWWVEDIQKEEYEPLLEEAEQSSSGSNGLFFLPYLSGERTPYNDPHAKGTFVGLTHRHTRGDMTRAILEGVAFSLYESLNIANQLNINISKLRVIGGGSKSTLWLQIIADIFGLQVEHCVSSGGPALGVALLALQGNNEQKTISKVQVSHILDPDESKTKIYQKRFVQYKKLYRHVKDAFHNMYKLERELLN